MAEAEAPQSESDVMRRGVAMLADRLPEGWTASLTPAPDGHGLIEVIGPNGQCATLLVEAKRIVEGRDVGALRAQLDVLSQRSPGVTGLVVARYLSPPVRSKLTEAGLSFIDATGNMRVELSTPGLFVGDRGADRDPWRGPGRPRGTLKGQPAAKVVRAIADFSGPWAIRDLIATSKASTGATYRIVEFLEREGLATRNDEGRIDVSDWTQVLRRWSDDYGFVRSNQTTRWIAPRGLPELTKRIGSTEEVIRYAITGTIAAAEWAAYAPARLAMIYVEDMAEAAATWGLRAVDAGANVILAQPKFEVVFERSLVNQDGLTIAAPSQVVVDLMTGPGRNPSEAEELLEWMSRNEQSWRS